MSKRTPPTDAEIDELLRLAMARNVTQQIVNQHSEEMAPLDIDPRALETILGQMFIDPKTLRNSLSKLSSSQEAFVWHRIAEFVFDSDQMDALFSKMEQLNHEREQQGLPHCRVTPISRTPLERKPLIGS